MATETVEALVEGGKATAAPPLGPALGPLGVNIGEVVAEINKKTASFKGMQVPVKVEVDTESKKFTVSVGTPPASALIKSEAGIGKASQHPGKELVADLKIEQVIKIAKMKEDDLLGSDLKAKVKEVLGTCKSMGVKVEGKPVAEVVKEVEEGVYNKEISEEKTEISEEERKELEEEKKELEEEIKKKHAEEEARAQKVMEELQGKPRSEVVAALREAGVSEDLIDKLLPAEKKEEGKA